MGLPQCYAESHSMMHSSASGSEFRQIRLDWQKTSSSQFGDQGRPHTIELLKYPHSSEHTLSRECSIGLLVHSTRALRSCSLPGYRTTTAWHDHRVIDITTRLVHIFMRVGLQPPFSRPAAHHHFRVRWEVALERQHPAFGETDFGRNRSNGRVSPVSVSRAEGGNDITKSFTFKMFKAHGN